MKKQKIKIPAILIEVSGGLVQRIASEGKVKVYLIDHDNLKEGGENPETYRMEWSTVDKVKSIKVELEKELSEYEKKEETDATH